MHEKTGIDNEKKKLIVNAIPVLSGSVICEAREIIILVLLA